jgi:hypothetical protein
MTFEFIDTFICLTLPSSCFPKLQISGVVRVYKVRGGGDKLSAEGTNTVGESGGMLPRENFEIQSLWNAISCILGWDLTKFRRI